MGLSSEGSDRQEQRTFWYRSRSVFKLSEGAASAFSVVPQTECFSE